jgi:hypothetical protein
MTLQKIQSIRTAIAALQAERSQLLTYKLSRAEVRAQIESRVSAWVETAREEAASNLRDMALGRGAHHLVAEVSEASRSFAATANLAPLLAAFGGEKKVVAHLLADIDTVPEGLDATAKAARMDAIAAELDALEREEEQLIEASEAAGEPIARRVDSRPEIVLGVPDVVPAKPYVKQSGEPREALNSPERLVAVAAPGVGVYSPR